MNQDLPLFQSAKIIWRTNQDLYGAGSFRYTSLFYKSLEYNQFGVLYWKRYDPKRFPLLKNNQIIGSKVRIYDTNARWRQSQDYCCHSAFPSEDEEASWRGSHAPRKLPYDAMFQGIYSLIIPIVTQEREGNYPYLNNFCFQSTFKSSTSFGLHYQSYKRIKAGTVPLPKRWGDVWIGREAETETYVLSMSIAHSFRGVSQTECVLVLMCERHCSHLPVTIFQRLLQLLKLYGQS